jgi:carbon monoxide dehydrogenase subunit G
MEMTGEQQIPVSQEKTWKALNDLDVLKACIPGCESIVQSGDNQYDVVLTAKVGPVSAKFKGKMTLSDLDPPNAYTMAFEGQGGVAGFARGNASVSLTSESEEKTKLAYAVKAAVGGKLAQIGSRLIDGAARKLAEQFFTAFNKHVSASSGS